MASNDSWRASHGGGAGKQKEEKMITKKRKIKPPEAETQSVRLELLRPAAHEVFVAGSFNDWQPTATPLKAVGGSRWAVELSLPPGRYEYRFLVDKEWVDDPTAQQIVPNPHGGANALLVVSGR